jgi:hypothetical protein
MGGLLDFGRMLGRKGDRMGKDWVGREWMGEEKSEIVGFRGWMVGLS